MRSKEEAHDYRYFPEPDLPALVVEPAWVDEVRAGLPELPEARKARLVSQYGLSAYDADLLVRLLAGGADYFEAMVRAGAQARSAGNWLSGEIRRRLKTADRDDMAAVPVTPEALAELVRLADEHVVSSTVAKEVLDTMWRDGRSARAIVEAEGLAQMSDADALGAIVEQVIAAHPDAVAQYRAGRTATFGFLVGQVMKASGGKANPKVAGDLLRRALGG
jgi:aspartyl-tRNA(Asn)/glutamyl-tRNA(Gln) amidotransferase subunit B